jgi:hypothetical protein
MLSFALLALTACAGGSAATSGNAAKTVPSAPLSTASFVISIPLGAPQSNRRSPLYVSPSTASVGISVSTGGPPQVTIANVTPGSPGCQTVSGVLTCTILANAPVGNDTFNVSEFDGPNTTGHLLASGGTTATIAAGVTNSVPLEVFGVVSSVALTFSPTLSPVNTITTAGTVTVNVSAKDGAGNVITGNYANPITLNSTDATGFATLSTTNVPNSTTVVTIPYTGGAAGPVVITAHAAPPEPPPGNSVTLFTTNGPITLTTGTPPVTITSLAFTTLNGAPPINISELGINSFTVSQCLTGGVNNGIVTVNTAPRSFSVTPAGPTHTGTCSITISTGGGQGPPQTVTFPVSVTLTPTTITI